MFSNYKLYDKKGRRLAIFGRIVESEMEIFVLTCSKKDSFDKKLAIRIYEQWVGGFPIEVNGKKSNPNVYKISAEDEQEIDGLFAHHCENKYYNCYPEYGVVKNHYMTRKQADELISQYSN